MGALTMRCGRSPCPPAWGKQMLEFHDNQTPFLDAGELDALVLGQALGHQMALAGSMKKPPWVSAISSQ